MQHSLLCYVSYPIFEIISFDVVSPFNFLSHSFYHRSTKYWNILNHIRKRTSLIPCLSYFVGMFLSLSLSLSHETQALCYLFFSTFYSDWNGSKRGHIYKFLRSQGFVSSYDTAHQYTDADAHKVQSLSLSLIRSLCLQCHALSCVVGEPPQPSWKHLRC